MPELNNPAGNPAPNLTIDAMALALQANMYSAGATSGAYVTSIPNQLGNITFGGLTSSGLTTYNPSISRTTNTSPSDSFEERVKRMLSFSMIVIDFLENITIKLDAYEMVKIYEDVKEGESFFVTGQNMLKKIIESIKDPHSKIDILYNPYIS